MITFDEAVAAARIAAAESGQAQWIAPSEVLTQGDGWYPQGSTWDGMFDGEDMTPARWLMVVSDYFRVFPSGLVLPFGLLPRVWRAASNLPPYTEYVYGTAEQADEYVRGVRVLHMIVVNEEHLTGRCVVDDKTGEHLLARDMPSWTRPYDAPPSHEDWPGVPEGTKVWPMVPSGFEKDFAFRY